MSYLPTTHKNMHKQSWLRQMQKRYEWQLKSSHFWVIYSEVHTPLYALLIHTFPTRVCIRYLLKLYCILNNNESSVQYTVIMTALYSFISAQLFLEAKYPKSLSSMQISITMNPLLPNLSSHTFQSSDLYSSINCISLVQNNPFLIKVYTNMDPHWNSCKFEIYHWLSIFCNTHTHTHKKKECFFHTL